MSESTSRRINEVEVIEGILVDAPADLTFYVSGEHLPDEDPDRGAQVTESALVPVHPPTIDEMMEIFRAWMRLDVADGSASPHTLRAYFADVRQHLEWLAEQGLLPAQASEEDLKEYRSYLVGEYALTTVGRKLASVRRFYGMAVHRGMLARNPAGGLKAPRDKTDRSERIKYLPLDAVRRVLSSPNVNTPIGLRDRAILVLMAMHGLRVVEVHRLDLDDIDLDSGEAGELHVFGKGDKRRTVLLVAESREVLRMWLAARALTRSSSPAVFLQLNWSNQGEPDRMSTRAVRARVDRYLGMCGLKRDGISCHSLRHSAATLSLAAGANLLAISQMLGHASVTTTQVYTRIIDKARHNPAKLLIGLLD